MMLKSIKGCEALKSYVVEKQGMGVNCLDCWSIIQEWKKIASDNERYIDLASEIYEIYLSSKAAPSDYTSLEKWIFCSCRTKCRSTKSIEITRRS